MKNILMSAYIVIKAFILWTVFGLIPMLIVFIPVLPIMLLAFPMMFLDSNHWSCKPYKWYFNNVWLRYTMLFEKVKH